MHGEPPEIVVFQSRRALLLLIEIFDDLKIFHTIQRKINRIELSNEVPK
jgi:hypothetical protein